MFIKLILLPACHLQTKEHLFTLYYLPMLQVYVHFFGKGYELQSQVISEILGYTTSANCPYCSCWFE